MQFIQTPDNREGTAALTNKIVSFLHENKKVLWFIPGGSNIPIAVQVMNGIRSQVESHVLNNLSIALTDERYGPVGHLDSNWKQLEDDGFDFTGINSYFILDGSSLVETVDRYGEIIQKIVRDADVIVGQFGMGADGHIAGILPRSPAVLETVPTAGYESKPFTRVTITFPILRQIDVAYMFVSNSTKKNAIDRLHLDNVSLDEQPAQILKEIPEVYVYID